MALNANTKGYFKVAFFVMTDRLKHIYIIIP